MLFKKGSNKKICLLLVFYWVLAVQTYKGVIK